MPSHLLRLNLVANCLRSVGFRVDGQNVSECQFFRPQVDNMLRRLTD
jgi:hypothetical protein